MTYLLIFLFELFPFGTQKFTNLTYKHCVYIRMGSRTDNGYEHTERCGRVFGLYTFPPVFTEVHECRQRTFGALVVFGSLLRLALWLLSGLALIGRDWKAKTKQKVWTLSAGNVLRSIINTTDNETTMQSTNGERRIWGMFEKIKIKSWSWTNLWLWVFWHLDGNEICQISVVKNGWCCGMEGGMGEESPWSATRLD